MLTYHKALDTNHAIFRVLTLLTFAKEIDLEIERLRILDFYYTFPHLIAQISFPAGFLQRKTEFKFPDNPYRYKGNAKFLLAQLRIFQETAINLLAAKELIDPDKVNQGKVGRGSAPIPSAIKDAISISISRDQELLSLLVNDFGKVPLLGSGGLKQRTGLMEYKYDDV